MFHYRNRHKPAIFSFHAFRLGTRNRSSPSAKAPVVNLRTPICSRSPRALTSPSKALKLPKIRSLVGAKEAPSAPWCPLNLSHLSRSIYMSTYRLARPTLELMLIAYAHSIAHRHGPGRPMATAARAPPRPPRRRRSRGSGGAPRRGHPTRPTRASAARLLPRVMVYHV